MNEKWTKGNWEHKATPGGWDGVYAGNQLLCNLALNVPENATLMAAAPELYEALKKTLEAIKMQGIDWQETDRDAFELAYSALAKAKGEPTK